MKAKEMADTNPLPPPRPSPIGWEKVAEGRMRVGLGEVSILPSPPRSGRGPGEVSIPPLTDHWPPAADRRRAPKTGAKSCQKVPKSAKEGRCSRASGFGLWL